MEFCLENAPDDIDVVSSPVIFDFIADFQYVACVKCDSQLKRMFAQRSTHSNNSQQSQISLNSTSVPTLNRFSLPVINH